MTTDTLEIGLPGALWDSVVDSLGQDIPRLSRFRDAWTYKKIGFGGSYRAMVSRSEAEDIEDYLQSVAGLLGQTWAADAESRPGMRSESNAAYRAAKAIRKALA